MADDIDTIGHAGGQRIDMTRNVDVAYWCRLFDVDPAQLRRAVQQVGPQSSAVARHLRRAEMPPPVLASASSDEARPSAT